MKLAWAMIPILLIQAAVAGAQNYRVETTKKFRLIGDVKLGSCGNGCCEGHDDTACAGVQIRNEYDRLLKTVIFDNVPCCIEQCPDRQSCGIFGLHRGPANSCPTYYGPFLVAFGKLNLCVAPGEVFRVPVRKAKLGNVVNNSWSGGSHCSPGDPFEPYTPVDFSNRETWGGFTDTCPNPQNPDIVCVPSDCDPAASGGGSHAVPRYAAEIIEPYGNEYYPRWDDPDVRLRWRPIGLARLDSYRVVVSGATGELYDEQVHCAADQCSHVVSMPLETATYYWWVQPRTATEIGDQSRAGYFTLTAPLTSCAGLGGSCSGYSLPGTEIMCPAGGVRIFGAADCRETCCSGDCSNEQAHDHTGSCGSHDSCGHVFGSPTDPGCEPTAPPDTPSCGALGGDYCSTTSSCPVGYASLGTTRLDGTIECQTCCQSSPCQSTGCPEGSCGLQTDNCGDQIFCGECGPSCGQMGGDYCSQSGTCPGGYAALGASYDCAQCCQTLPSCGAMGGDYCSTSASCPSGYTSLGPSGDCVTCCKTRPCQSTGCPPGACGWQTDNCGNPIHCGQCAPTCGAMGGDYCSQSTSCPAGYTSLGQSSDCTRCCKSPPSCGAMGGTYCSQSGSCPSGYHSLGRSNDCVSCCVEN